MPLPPSSRLAALALALGLLAVPGSATSSDTAERRVTDADLPRLAEVARIYPQVDRHPDLDTGRATLIQIEGAEGDPCTRYLKLAQGSEGRSAAYLDASAYPPFGPAYTGVETPYVTVLEMSQTRAQRVIRALRAYLRRCAGTFRQDGQVQINRRLDVNGVVAFRVLYRETTPPSPPAKGRSNDLYLLRREAGRLLFVQVRNFEERPALGRALRLLDTM